MERLLTGSNSSTIMTNGWQDKTNSIWQSLLIGGWYPLTLKMQLKQADVQKIGAADSTLGLRRIGKCIAMMKYQKYNGV